MGAIQDTFFNSRSQYRLKEKYNIAKLVKCEDTVLGISNNIPSKFKNNIDIIEFADLESAHIHHERYGFSVESNGYKLGFASHVCPKNSQLIDLVSKNEVEGYYHHFHEDVNCIRVCFIGLTDSTIE